MVMAIQTYEGDYLSGRLGPHDRTIVCPVCTLEFWGFEKFYEHYMQASHFIELGRVDRDAQKFSSCIEVEVIQQP